ncbi:inner nuclear membrane protein enriched at telomere/subtelomere region [Podospora pseudoanserina]|uniref:Inner nuclear membrane protein enriched at telomere/subtelomere region n=1 Tax=Podospora pseudoanserina TaxID=2609844 RepID=A0ABR0IQ60_9PEZI|nr:inner nuclear membrane protein enriched at telomere/subtelomere region [Podospora pseudoanserina]
MSDTESVDYLQPDFDPKSLTVPRLRSILVTYNVQYPSTAKKSDLIELFVDQVLPQSKKILAARARVKRMSRGIVDADSVHTSSTDFGNDYEDLPPPPASVSRRSRSPRKPTRIKRESEDPEHLPVVTPARNRASSPRKRTSRSVSAQPPSFSDAETAAEPEPPRTITRETPFKTPKAEPDQRDNFFKRTPETESVFSSDNPFQSGANTPATAIKTPSHRRKTSGFDSVRRQQFVTPSTSRRQTDGPVFGGTPAPSTISRTFEIPAANYRAQTPEMETGEEFTPDEQLALMQEEAANPQLALARQPPPPKKKSSLSTPFWVLFTTLLVAYAAWYRQEKVAVGYCGLGREPTELIPSTIRIPEWASEVASRFDIEDIQVPEWVFTYIEPQCEPCPPHAYCYEDFTARCEPDFLLKPHPLSLGGVIPLPPTCEPDGEKVRRVQAVADKAVEELRDRRAKYECGEPLEPEGQPLDSPSIDEAELKQILSQKRSKRMAADEFDDLWVAAIGEVKSRGEVEVHSDENVTGSAGGFPTTSLSSTSLAGLPLTCAIQRSAKLGLARHRLSIGGLIMSLLSILYGRRRFQKNRALAARVPALVDVVLDRLANQKELAFEDEKEDAFLFLPNLRDDLLRSMHSLADRERLWTRVRALVEQNANVRTGQRESHNGEVGRAWEWIGPSRIANGEGSARRSGRKSMRVSWSPGVKDKDEQEVVPHRKWEEGPGRPIY